MRDLKSNNQLVHLGKLSLSGTTPAASAWVDTRGYDAAMLVLATQTVTVAGTSGFTATAQHSDTTAAAAAAALVAGESTDGTFALTVTADTDDDKIIGGVGYRGAKRYLRFNVVGTTNTNAVVEVWAILRRGSQLPSTLVGTSVAAT